MKPRAALAVLAAACVLAAATAARAQDTIRPARLHVALPYGLDALTLYVDRIERVAHIDGRAYVRDQRPAGDTGYLIVSLRFVNPHAASEDLPLLQTAVVTDDGRTIDPAVYGPYAGTSLREPPVALRPKASVALRLIVLDVPAAREVRELRLSPNDTSPRYRFRLRAGDVARLPDVPR